MQNRAKDTGLYARTIGARWLSPRHYYGDVVRAFFLGAAVIMLLGAPFYSDDLSTQLPYIVVGAVVLVGLAALTNPRETWIVVLDVAAAGIGAISYESWALMQYHAEDPIQFVLREAPAIIFLLAFYYSVKTYRAMMLGQVNPEVVSEAQPREIIDPYEAREDALGNPAAPEVIQGGE